MGKSDAAQTIRLYGGTIVEYNHRSGRSFCVDYRSYNAPYELRFVVSTLDAHQAYSGFFVDGLPYLELENFERNSKRYLQNEICSAAYDE